MIPLTRGAVRTFLAVARRAALPGRRPGFAPVARIATGPDEVFLAAHHGRVVVGRRFPAVTADPAEAVVPLDALKALDGRGDGPVTLEPAGPEVWTARWADAAGPQEARLPVAPAGPLTWPAEPEALVLVSPAFPAALHEAGRVTAREPREKYATDHIQVRGQAGQVLGTDGKQALTVAGFRFPFPDDLLVPAVPVFGCKEVAREAAVSVGLAGDWLFVVAGPWRVWLRTDRGRRFPDVVGATPKAVGTRVKLAETDADRLRAELPGLPGPADVPGRPVTVDLAAGRVVVRARADEAADPVEVRLPDSAATGRPVRLVLSRDHLGRALALGCRVLSIPDPGRPVVFRGPDTTYLTVPFDPASAVLPPAGVAIVSTLARSPAPDRRPVMPTRDAPAAETNGHPDPATPPDGYDPLAEAEDLKAALAEATGRAARLVAALKTYRRERKSLQVAWTSLRALNLGP